MNIAIVTARGGSSRLAGKHTMRVGPKQYRLIEYPLRAALDAGRVDAVYLATDSAELGDIAQGLGARLLRLPPGLCGDGGTQAASLCWAVGKLDVDSQSPIKNIVTLLGNTVMIEPEDIDLALDTLDMRPEATSVMSVWQAEDDHPMRAMELSYDGFLAPYNPASTSDVSNVQTYSPAYYHDQGLWAFRKECAYEQSGPPPWTWCGKRCLALTRPWFVGRDVDVKADLEIAEWYLQRKETGNGR